MNTNDILELVRAGYSKSEIEAMNGETEKTDSEPKAEQEEIKTEQEVKPSENGKSEVAQLTELVKNLTETVKAMQADNAKKVSGEPPKTETADSAIRSFFGEVPKK